MHLERQTYSGKSRPKQRLASVTVRGPPTWWQSIDHKYTHTAIYLSHNMLGLDWPQLILVLQQIFQSEK